MTRATRGLTLIELVVAMAIFALVAVMGLLALSGALRMRADLGARADRAEALGRATTLLRADLKAIVPMLFFPPDRAPPQSAVRAIETYGLAMSLAGQPRLTASTGQATDSPGLGHSLGLGRVEWRLEPGTGTEAGQLVRQSWPVLYPLSATQQGPAVVMLDRVDAFGIRTFWGDLGWISGVRPVQLENLAPTAAPNIDSDTGPTVVENYSDLLPLAIEVTFDSRDYGTITLIEALQ